MSLLKPQHLANCIAREVRELGFIDLTKVMFEVIQKHHFIESEEETWDYVEQYIEDVSRELFEKESRARECGMECSFDIDEEHGTYYIRYSCPSYKEVLDAIGAISPDQFERLCSCIITRMGGAGKDMGGDDDGGIDFIGENLLLTGIPALSHLPASVYLLGQAKHYKDGNQITLIEARAFIGSAVKRQDELIRSGAKRFQPVIFAFWTTSDFHKDAYDYFRDLGVWALNGQQLSSLANSLGFTPEEIRGL